MKKAFVFGGTALVLIEYLLGRKYEVLYLSDKDILFLLVYLNLDFGVYLWHNRGEV